MGCRNGKKKAETATLKKCRDRSFTWCAETGKMAFCIFLCRNGVIPYRSLPKMERIESNMFI